MPGMNAPATVWHLAVADDWAAARRIGSHAVSTLGRTIEQVGYLHCSVDREQADATARRFYREVSRPLVLLEIDVAALALHGLRVVLEPADPTVPGEAGELFPHVYGGPLPIAAVRSVTPYVVPGSA